jgi:hypothetical protein
VSREHARKQTETYVDHDAGVGVAVGTRERHEVFWLRSPSATPANAGLNASLVELGATLGSGEVERDDLVANHVVPRCDV